MGDFGGEGVGSAPVSIYSISIPDLKKPILLLTHRHYTGPIVELIYLEKHWWISLLLVMQMFWDLLFFI